MSSSFEPTKSCPIAAIPLSSILKCLSYDELVRNNIVPNLRLPQTLETKRYPKVVYDLKKFGNNNGPEILERLLKNEFLSIDSQNFTAKLNFAISGSLNLSLKTEQVNFQPIAKLINFIKTAIGSFQTQQVAKLNFRINQLKITSTIDVLMSSHMLSIRVIGNPATEFETIILELLAQKALLDQKSTEFTDTKISFIGLLLPLHETILWFDVTTWNSDRLYNILLSSLTACEQDMCVAKQPIIESLSGVYNLNIFGHPCKAVNEEGIGSHWPVNDEFPTHIPFQTFISNPQGNDLVSDIQLKKLLAKRKPGLRWFVHAAYIINLCNTNSISLEKLQNELIASVHLGCKGVVFHVGKYTSMTYEDGLHNMIYSIRYMLRWATVETPLILETPAGQGTELGGSFESFSFIMSLFPDDIGKRFRVCVDTCHVFSLGYDPLWFIENLEKLYPGSVAVVHYNDSSNPRGERVDRHFVPGLGYIGYERMMAVYYYCISHNIPMIRE